MGGLGDFARDLELRLLNGVVRFELAQTGFDLQNQHQMRERAEARRLGAAAPHVENRAALDAGAGAHGAFIGRGGKHRHTGETMRQSVADRDYRPQHTGKNLRLASEFDARFDDVADPGHAHRFTRVHDVELRRLNARVLQHALNQIVAIDFERALLITVRGADSNSAHWKFCDLKSHGYKSLLKLHDVRRLVPSAESENDLNVLNDLNLV